MKKIVFLTYHNWETKRYGGFHKLAYASCKKGFYTIFFSYPRPWFIFFMHHEVYNRKVLLKLAKGVKYKVGNSVLYNFTLPNLCLPLNYKNILGESLFILLKRISLINTRVYFKIKFSGTKYFVFESTESVLLFRTIKRLFPNSKYIYRPSDPLICNKENEWLFKYEKDILLHSDLVFLVNIQGLNKYKKLIPNFEDCVNYRILSNGVEVSSFKKKYPKPKVLEGGKNALYVGALKIDWEMIVEASKLSRNIKFVIITPSVAPDWFLNEISKLPNLIFINGINPQDVPAWITNTDVFIVPYPKELYKKWAWGMTSKYYQAIAAKKPIVAFHDSSLLCEYGINVTYTTEDFVLAVNECLSQNQVNYKVDLSNKNWDYITDVFFNEIEKL